MDSCFEPPMASTHVCYALEGSRQLPALSLCWLMSKLLPGSCFKPPSANKRRVDSMPRWTSVACHSRCTCWLMRVYLQPMTHVCRMLPALSMCWLMSKFLPGSCFEPCIMSLEVQEVYSREQLHSEHRTCGNTVLGKSLDEVHLTTTHVNLRTA